MVAMCSGITRTKYPGGVRRSELGHHSAPDEGHSAQNLGVQSTIIQDAFIILRNLVVLIIKGRAALLAAFEKLKDQISHSGKYLASVNV